MSFFDLSLKELQTYCPDRDEPADFELVLDIHIG